MAEGIYWRGKFWRIAGGDEGDGDGGTTDQSGQEPNTGGQDPPANTGDKTGDGQTGGGGQTGGQDPPKTETFGRDYVEQLRRENADWRKRATSAETKVTEHEREKLSETERKDAEIADLKKQNADLAHKATTATIRSAIEREAVAAGAVDPEAVYALLDKSTLEVGDDGQVKGAKAAVKALLDAKTYLKKPEGGTTKGVPPTGEGSNGNSKDFETRVAETRKELQRTGNYGRL